MYKLLVLPNFQKYKRGIHEEGSYILILPYGVNNSKHEALWGHFCTNSSFAFMDLKYPNRKKFLDEYFGEGNWEFELYDFTTTKEFERYCQDIAQECDLEKLTEQFEYYKTNNIYL